VDTGDDAGYTVDFFRVKGGDQHTYSFHTQSYQGYSTDLKLVPQVDKNGEYVGTYAGRDVPYGEDPNSDITHANYETKYPRGYTWLTEVNRAEDIKYGTFFVNFKQTDFNDSPVDAEGLNIGFWSANDWTPSEVAFVTGYAPRTSSNKNIPGLDYMLIHRKGKDLDMDNLLSRFAASWTDDAREAEVLKKAWKMCDEIDASRGSKAFWTTSTFVSSRTLFRHMVQPIVPDPSKITYAEGRYYKPYSFWCLATDPAWHDITYFGFERRTSDEQLEETVKYMDSDLLPKLRRCAEFLEGETNPTLVDIRQRVQCFLYISETERHQMDVQLQIHRYKENPQESYRDIIRKDMQCDIETTEKFVNLLKNAENVLIPTTSGEETTYMFKAPLWPTLEQKIAAMKNHFDDIPGPHFFEDKYYLG